MGQDSLLGVRRAATEAEGRDNAALGPGDSSDSGSDMAGVTDAPGTDPFLPVDVALRDDAQHPLQARAASRDGADTDAAGTGERRSAGNDAGAREGADISVDRVVDDPALHDDEDPDLAFMDGLQDAGATLVTAAAPDPMSDEGPAAAEASIDAAAARRSAMHDRERDARLGRLHCKGKKPRPMFGDD